MNSIHSGRGILSLPDQTIDVRNLDIPKKNGITKEKAIAINPIMIGNKQETPFTLMDKLDVRVAEESGEELRLVLSSKTHVHRKKSY